MAFIIRLISASNLCLQVHSGRIGATEFDAIRDAFGNLSGYRPDLDHLVVLAPNADYSDFDHEMAKVEAQLMADGSRTLGGGVLKRLAFLCANLLQVSMTRMFAAQVEARVPTATELATFTDLEAAFSWLEHDRNPQVHIDRAELEVLLREAGQDWCCRRPQSGN